MYLEFVFVLVHQTDDNDYKHYHLQYEVDVCLKKCPRSKNPCQYSPQNYYNTKYDS